MSARREEILVDELVSNLYEIFYADKRSIINPVLTPVVFSRIIKFIREFNDDPDFFLGVDSIDSSPRPDVYWLCYRGSKASVLKGFFMTLDEAKTYYDGLSKVEKLKMVVCDKNRNPVYPIKYIKYGVE